MPNLRRQLLIKFGPGMFPGIKKETWNALLKENTVDSPYRFRAALVSFLSLLTSPICALEERNLDPLLARVSMEDPIFILGHSRSGTTHLHQILTRDRQFGFPRLYESYFPHTFYNTEWLLPKLLDPFYQGRRLQDNLVRDLSSPGEEEAAVCIGTGKSPWMSIVFPRNRERYDRYLTFRHVSPSDIAHWQNGLLWFLKKLTLKYQKPLVLKSATNTCRIKLLLAMFPRARFINIHRHPFEVFNSTVHLDRVSLDAWGLQTCRENRTIPIIQRYKEMYDVFFEEKRLIPEGQFFELKFNDLVRDPFCCIESLYRAFNIRGFKAFAPTLRQYIATLSGFQKNEYGEIPCGVRSILRETWAQSFEEWKYSP
jgi:hypothetical protein